MSKPKIDLSDLLDEEPTIDLSDLIDEGPIEREQLVAVVHFWAHYVCQCGRHYEAPLYQNSVMLKYRVDHRCGFGWRFHHIHYTPSFDVGNWGVPYETETHLIPVHHCINCTQPVIYLPGGDA